MAPGHFLEVEFLDGESSADLQVPRVDGHESGHLLAGHWGLSVAWTRLSKTSQKTQGCSNHQQVNAVQSVPSLPELTVEVRAIKLPAEGECALYSQNDTVPCLWIIGEAPGNRPSLWGPCCIQIVLQTFKAQSSEHPNGKTDLLCVQTAALTSRMERAVRLRNWAN